MKTKRKRRVIALFVHFFDTGACRGNHKCLHAVSALTDLALLARNQEELWWWDFQQCRVKSSALAVNDFTTLSLRANAVGTQYAFEVGAEPIALPSGPLCVAKVKEA